MGAELDPVTIHAFRDELEKFALFGAIGRGIVGAGKSLGQRATGIGKNVAEIGKRVANPVQGFREGSKHLSPAGTLSMGGARAAKLQKAIGKTEAGGAIRSALGAGTHLRASSQTLGAARQSGGLKGVAEELSRRGWTGKSRATKYMPLGDKGQLATVWPALSVPMVASGESSLGEEAGSNLGYLGGALLTAGTGLPGFAATMAAGHFGGQLGRKIQAAKGAGAAVPQGEQG